MVSVPNHPTECVVNMLIFRTIYFYAPAFGFGPMLSLAAELSFTVIVIMLVSHGWLDDISSGSPRSCRLHRLPSRELTSASSDNDSTFFEKGTYASLPLK